MAKALLIHAFASYALIVSLVTNQIFHAEGRNFVKSGKEDNLIPTQFTELQHPGSPEDTKIEHLAFEEGVGHPESYRHGFQELTTTDSVNTDNGPRPPPRASTVPGHSPGSGHPESDKHGFQELTTTINSVDSKDNGRRPPPRASTVPGHSPGDGN